MKNKKKILLIVAFLIILLAVLKFFIKTDKVEENKNYIGIGTDVASFIVEEAVKDNKKFEIDEESLSVYPINDCCGNKASWALVSNHISMSIMCPDAAKKYIKENDDYIIAGDIVYNAEVLVSKDKNSEINNIGYMQGREIHRKFLNNEFGNEIKYLSVQNTALSYALETGEVDAAFIDLNNAIFLEDNIKYLNNKKPSYVLVCHKDFIKTKAYKEFVVNYNNIIKQLENESYLEKILSKYFEEEITDKEVNRWKKSNIIFKTIE